MGTNNRLLISKSNSKFNIFSITVAFLLLTNFSIRNLECIPKRKMFSVCTFRKSKRLQFSPTHYTTLYYLEYLPAKIDYLCTLKIFRSKKMTKLVSKNGTYSDNWLVCHVDCLSGKKQKTKWRSTDWCVTEGGVSPDGEIRVSLT